MFCPFCKNTETTVKDSRLSEDGTSIRRRRECPECSARFTTYERIQFKEVMVIKKSGEKEFFDREKLVSSIRMALRKRNVSPDIVEKMAAEIHQELCQQNESEIPSGEIGELVMKQLKGLDKVAFVRFASVYKNFDTPEDFVCFLKSN